MAAVDKEYVVVVVVVDYCQTLVNKNSMTRENHRLYSNSRLE